MSTANPTGSANTRSATTSTWGSYTITALGIGNNTITRNEGATIVLTNQDEWYKAAYYDPGTTTYFDFAAGSDTATTCAAAGGTAKGTVVDAAGKPAAGLSVRANFEQSEVSYTVDTDEKGAFEGRFLA